MKGFRPDRISRSCQTLLSLFFLGCSAAGTPTYDLPQPPARALLPAASASAEPAEEVVEEAEVEALDCAMETPDRRCPPQVSAGRSCESAVDDYSRRQKIKIHFKNDADRTLEKQLNAGAYLNRCGTPPSTEVKICTAVQQGLPVGITVNLEPENPGIASCIAGQVRQMQFIKHNWMDPAHTSFAPI